jgi:hypothetical protein
MSRTVAGKGLWEYLVPHLPTAFDAGFVSGSIDAIEVEAAADERSRIRSEIAVIRDDPALDGVMGLGWDAIEQIIGKEVVL